MNNFETINRPDPCRCGGAEIVRGGNPDESLVHCQKCRRMVAAKTIAEAFKNGICLH